MDRDAARIADLVIEAGALVDWLETGRGDIEIVGAALIYLRDELSTLAEHTSDPQSSSAACGMVEVIDATLAAPPARREHRAA